MKKKVGFMCTAFRDGLESAYGARVLSRDFLPALEAARDAGVEYFEAGGGGRFEPLYSHCNEDAFDMMDAFRQTVGPKAQLQSLAEGISVVGGESQSRDIVTLHAELFGKHGISAIRNFDALNDVNNLIYSGRCIVEAGLKHQVCVTMMSLPPGWEGAHDAEAYVEVLRRILDAEIPFDSVCFMDASGTVVPSTVYATIKGARKMLPKGTRVHYGTRDTAGMAVAANIAALEADADTIDLSLAPCSGGAGQPDLLVMWHTLQGTEYELDIDIHKVREVEAFYRECMKEYSLSPEAMAIDPMVIWNPMPGGALAAQMLRDKGMVEKYPEMVRVAGEVIQRGGCGTSVTSVCEAYLEQALNNVTFGPWKMIAESYGRLVLGYLGTTPVPPDPKVVELAASQLGLEATKRPPLELNDEDPEKGVEAARRQLKAHDLEETAENIFIAATCKNKGLAFLSGETAEVEAKIADEEEAEATAPDKAEEVAALAPPLASASGRYALTVNGNDYDVALDGERVTVQGKVYQVTVRHGEAAVERAAPEAAAPAPAAPQKVEEVPVSAASGTQVLAPMPGTVTNILLQAGARVAADETILLIEAMKMETPVSSPVEGTVTEVPVAVGDHVNTGDVLAIVAG